MACFTQLDAENMTKACDENKKVYYETDSWM